MPFIALVLAVVAVALFVIDALPDAQPDTRGHRLASWGLALMSSAFILTFALEAERITFG